MGFKIGKKDLKKVGKKIVKSAVKVSKNTAHGHKDYDKYMDKKEQKALDKQEAAARRAYLVSKEMDAAIARLDEEEEGIAGVSLGTGSSTVRI